jgi:SAM-dependent methyltransferase
MAETFKPHDIQWTYPKIDHLWAFYGTTPAYDELYFSFGGGISLIRFVRRYLSLKDRLVLDYGSGRGYMLQLLLKMGITCQGLDFSAGSVELIQKTLGGHPLFRGMIHAPDVPTPVADGSMDVVLLLEVVEHLFDDQLAPTFQDIYRILKPGGYLVVTTPNAENLEQSMIRCPECGCTFHRWQHMRSVTPELLRGWVTAGGFHEIVTRTTYFWPTRGWLDDLKIQLGVMYRTLTGVPEPTQNLVTIVQKPH